MNYFYSKRFNLIGVPVLSVITLLLVVYFTHSEGTGISFQEIANAMKNLQSEHTDTCTIPDYLNEFFTDNDISGIIDEIEFGADYPGGQEIGFRLYNFDGTTKEFKYKSIEELSDFFQDFDGNMFERVHISYSANQIQTNLTITKNHKDQSELVLAYKSVSSDGSFIKYKRLSKSLKAGLTISEGIAVDGKERGKFRVCDMPENFEEES